MASTDVTTGTALPGGFYTGSDNVGTEFVGEVTRHDSPTHRADLCSTCGLRTIILHIHTIAEEERAKERANGDVNVNEDEDGDEEGGDEDGASETDRTEYDDVVKA
jgi:predicted  nucleic acid-binding Zn-ribbon protein